MMAPVGAKNWRKMASPVYILHLISTHFFSVRVAYSNCKKTLVFYMCNAMRAHGAKFKFYYFDFFFCFVSFLKRGHRFIFSTCVLCVCVYCDFFLNFFFNILEVTCFDLAYCGYMCYGVGFFFTDDVECFLRQVDKFFG